MKVRKLHEKDWRYLPNWEGVADRESLPQNGTGGFIIEAQPDRTPIAALWIDIKDDIATMSNTISNEMYKDTDKEDAIHHLEKFSADFVATMEYELIKQ